LLIAEWDGSRCAGRALASELDGDGACAGLRWRHGLPVSAKAFHVKGDCLANQLLDFLGALAGGDAPGEVGNVRGVRIAGAFDDDEVVSHVRSSLRPAWRRMLARVPALRSFPRLPATVTVPAFVGWRNSRWLPAWRSRCQPSARSMSIASRTFTAGHRSKGGGGAV
jgi:hypothetical protein